ncbi:MAG: hypothetical protein ACI9WU_002153 [Myxococcota bacterium]|jgi:hypothetical protein
MNPDTKVMGPAFPTRDHLPPIDLAAQLEPEAGPDVSAWLDHGPSLELDVDATEGVAKPPDAYIEDGPVRRPLFVEQWGRSGMLAWIPGVAPPRNFRIHFLNPDDGSTAGTVGCRTAAQTIGPKGSTRKLVFTMALADGEDALLRLLVDRMLLGDLPAGAIRRAKKNCAYDFSKSRAAEVLWTLEEHRRERDRGKVADERRVSPRVHLVERLTWCVGALTWEGVARQVSRTGVLVQTKDAVPAQDEQVSVDFPLPTGLVTLVGKVLRIQTTGNEVGFALQIQRIEDGACGAHWHQWIDSL